MQTNALLTDASTGADTLAGMLADLGVRYAFGMLGGAIAKFCSSMRSHGIEIIHARHETGAAFMASEAYFASGDPSVVFTTTGPGATNAITGLVAAAWDGAKIVAITGATNPSSRGRRAFQETGPGAIDLSPWFGTSSGYLSYTIDSVEQLPILGRKLAVGLARPGGFVANLAFPMAAQGMRARPTLGYGDLALAETTLSPRLVQTLHRRLSSAPFVVWVGYGAREHGPEIVEMVERSGAMVMCSPRAKGVFPEHHPQYLGVTGMFGGHVRVQRYLRDNRPDYVLVLGSRLNESTSCYDPLLTPRRAFIHVDLDPEVFGVAYPEVKTLGVNTELGQLVVELARLWPPLPSRPREAVPQLVGEYDDGGPIHPRRLMDAVQHVIVERSNAIVLADVGNAFAWTNYALRFCEPGRYRVSPGFAAMTQAAAGVVGAALASDRPAVALVGDGAMLMGNELSTAVAHGLEAKWIVLNDAGYGMVRHGMAALGVEPLGADIPRTDFCTYAEAIGAHGIRVNHGSELERALRTMLATPGPVVVDVDIDPRPVPPFGRRNQALEQLWSPP